jgi:general secretion pathway protein G
VSGWVAGAPVPGLRGRSGGFTLLEMMIVVAILGVLALGLLPLNDLAVQRAKESELRMALRQIRGALDAYKRAAEEGRVERKADESGYPRRLEDLVSGVKDAKAADGRKIHFLRRVPRDPFADAALPAERSWGLRSYASAPDSPAEGRDVFDVYSRSERVGLNGVPYRQW